MCSVGPDLRAFRRLASPSAVSILSRAAQANIRLYLLEFKEIRGRADWRGFGLGLLKVSQGRLSNLEMMSQMVFNSISLVTGSESRSVSHICARSICVRETKIDVRWW